MKAIRTSTAETRTPERAGRGLYDYPCFENYDRLCLVIFLAVMINNMMNLQPQNGCFMNGMLQNYIII